MKNIAIYFIPLTLFMILLFAACNKSTPPGETVMDTCIAIANRLDSLARIKEISSDEANSRLEAEISNLDLDNMTLDQVERIAKGGMLYRYNSLRKVCQSSLNKLTKDKSIDGARAAAMLTINFPMADDPDDIFSMQLLWVEAYRKFVNHPSIAELMMSDDRLSSTVFGRLQFLDTKAVGKSGLINEMIPLLKYPMSLDCGSATVIFFDVVSNPEAACSEELVQEVRRKVLKKTQETLERYKEENSNANSSIKHLEHVIAYLDGASSRGELVGFNAPEIHFDYSSMENTKLLSDLKGKVVIIDFWATWCSPCIGSFPNIRALQERYKDYPVVILGVTSLQGSHTDQINKRRIDTKGNPELEYSLMDQFIKDMDITWDIAFSKESQFNEEFGVRGIPHVAIIDPEGIVRYNRLRPYHPPWQEAEKIDNLLKEAGLDFPGKAMGKINYSDEDH